MAQGILMTKSDDNKIVSADALTAESQSMTDLYVSQFAKKNRNATSNSNFTAGSRSAFSAPAAQTLIKSTTRSKVYRKASLKTPEDSNQRKIFPKQRSFSTDFPISATFETSLSHLAETFKDSRSCLRDGNSDSNASSALDRSKSSVEENGGGSDAKMKWNEGNVHITCNPLSTPYPYSTPCHKDERIRVTETQEEEPKAHSCGNFLPILSLIPLTLVSFQYLSPKMKFSWWRNKIS